MRNGVHGFGRRSGWQRLLSTYVDTPNCVKHSPFNVFETAIRPCLCSQIPTFSYHRCTSSRCFARLIDNLVPEATETHLLATQHFSRPLTDRLGLGSQEPERHKWIQPVLSGTTSLGKHTLRFPGPGSLSQSRHGPSQGPRWWTSSGACIPHGRSSRCAESGASTPRLRCGGGPLVRHARSWAR
jgi:hypothetical protein